MRITHLFYKLVLTRSSLNKQRNKPKHLVSHGRIFSFQFVTATTFSFLFPLRQPKRRAFSKDLWKMKTQLLIVLTIFTTGILSAVANSTQKACPAVNGHPGIPGSPGLPGPYGRDGAKGEKGETGKTGLKGQKGGTQASSNWKQRVWRGEDLRDHGLLKDCLFNKMHDNTTLRVFYSGALRIFRCTNCCKRWFFTFNGAECSGPMPIDGIVYIHGVSGLEPLRVRHFEGYCENILKGRVRVGFNVGNCGGYGNADASSGWNSVPRIVIEEVPAPQQ
ncbi:uncharacterized protein LOC144651837 isoform X2 [Oculina patagonica]